jgi:DNA-binding NarL/FixJ family response regulator
MVDSLNIIRRVVIADSSRIACAALKTAFDGRAEYIVVGTPRDLPSALDAVDRTEADIIILGENVLASDSPGLVSRTRAMRSVCKVVMSDQAAEDIVFSSPLEAIGASLCLSRYDVTFNPDSLFARIAIACARIEDQDHDLLFAPAFPTGSAMIRSVGHDHGFR